MIDKIIPGINKMGAKQQNGKPKSPTNIKTTPYFRFSDSMVLLR